MKLNHKQRRVQAAKLRHELRQLERAGVSPDVLAVARDLVLAQQKSDEPIVKGEQCQPPDHNLLERLTNKKQEEPLILRLE